MRIIFLISDSAAPAVHNATVSLARNLQQRGLQVNIIRQGEAITGGVLPRFRPDGRRRKKPSDLDGIAIKTVEKFDPIHLIGSDCVIAHDAESAHFLIASTCLRPQYYFVHDDAYLAGEMARIAVDARAPMHFITSSRYTARKLKPLLGTRPVTVIPYGRNFGQTALKGSARQGTYDIVADFSGVPEIYASKTLQALQQLWRIFPALNIVVIDDARLPSLLSAKKRETNWTPGKIRKLLLRTRILLNVGVSDIFPQRALDAMGMGCIVVGANGGALPEIVTHGLNGFVFPCSHQPSMLAHLSTILENPSLEKQMLLASVSKSDAFTWDSAADRLHSLLDARYYLFDNWDSGTYSLMPAEPTLTALGA